MRSAILILMISILPTTVWGTNVEVKSLADLKDQLIKLAINPFFDKYSESERTASFATRDCRVQVSGLNSFNEYRDMTLSKEATEWSVGNYRAGFFINNKSENALAECAALRSRGQKAACIRSIEKNMDFRVLDSVSLKSSDGSKTMRVFSVNPLKKEQGIFECLGSTGFEVPQTVNRPSAPDVVSDDTSGSAATN